MIERIPELRSLLLSAEDLAGELLETTLGIGMSANPNLRARILLCHCAIAQAMAYLDGIDPEDAGWKRLAAENRPSQK